MQPPGADAQLNAAFRAPSPPIEEGLDLAKDIWMLGIAAGLLADAVTDRGNQRDQK